MATLTTFEELECYQRCRELRIEVSHLVRQWPSEEKWRLADQILRSSRSVTANIAEGFGRHHHQENLQFCRQARGSLTETLEHTAGDEGLISENDLVSFRRGYEECLRLVNGYIQYLAKAASALPKTSRQKLHDQ